VRASGIGSVEFAVGYPNHGFETREYRGGLAFAADASGTIAVVNLVSLEDLLRGLVPSEIFSAAPAEALKAQAVTARGEVLAKVGTRHLADPYLLCSEQHCAVYRGRTGETQATNAAVEATRGLPSSPPRDAWWTRSGRGVRRPPRTTRPCGAACPIRACAAGPTCSSGGGDARPETRAGPVPRLRPSGSLPARALRPADEVPLGERFTAQQLDALVDPLKVGSVRHLQPLERGASGRCGCCSCQGPAGPPSSAAS
jgi:hypothetical protein